MRLIATLCLLFSLGCSVASAKDQEPHQISLDARFDAIRAEIVREVERGDLYREISSAEQTSLFDQLTQLDALIKAGQMADPAGRQSAEQLQASINALLARVAEDSKLVCRRERGLGSNIPTRVCMTVAARRRQEEAASKDDVRRQMDSPGGSGR
ncbi:MAG TPA: hypothetical protein PK027_01485 [Aquimonas sp.]|jgi:hypothetical protein|nr:hypothetical protein [Xanthomonadales bacterium]HRD72479.1 hypothetical protein [Aquimonas sp.]HRF53117.1 hypothetical protein [Aquimonas sp.]